MTVASSSAPGSAEGPRSGGDAEEGQPGACVEQDRARRERESQGRSHDQRHLVHADGAPILIYELVRGPARRPVTARTIATTSAPIRRKKTTASTAAISKTGGPAGWAKIPWNGRTSGSVIA